MANARHQVGSPVRRRHVLAVGAAVLTLAAAAACAAERTGGSTTGPLSAGAELTSRPKDKTPKAKPERGLRLQLGEDLLTPLKRKPTTPDEQKKREALAWYLVGRLRHERGQLKEALQAYERAVELDPTRSEVYRALVGVAIELRQNEKAIQYALRAIQLNPDDFLLLRMAGTYLASRPGGLSQAVQLLERAARSPKIDRHSGFYVTLMRDLGSFYVLLQRPQKAAQCFEVVLQARLHPEKFRLDARTREILEKDKASSFEAIGRVFSAAGRFQQAITAFQKALQSGTASASVSYDLAYAYFKLGQLDKALTTLQQYFDKQLQSKGAAAYRLLGDILAKQGRAKELISRLEQLRRQDPENAPLAYFLAEQYVKAGRLDDAEKLYQKVLSRSEDAGAYVGLATVYRLRGNAEKLLDCLSKVLESPEASRQYEQELERELEAIAKDKKILGRLLDVGVKRLQSKEKPLDFASSYVLGRLAILAKRTDDVLRFFRRAISLQKSPQRVALLYEQLGEYLLDQQEYQKASDVFRQAYQTPSLVPLQAYFAVRLSQALELAGRTDEALRVIGDARRQNDTPQLQVQEAWIYYHAYRWDQAAEAFRRIIEKYKNSKDQRLTEIVRRCKLSLANIHVEKGELQKGEAILEEVWRENPDDPSVNNDLGYLWADQGKNLEQAEKMIRKALQAEPDNAAYLDSMGWVLFRKGQYKKAMEYLLKAVEKSEEVDAVIWEHVGDCYQKLGQLDKAIEAWRKALEKEKKDRRPDQKLIQRVEKKIAETKGRPPDNPGRSSETPTKEKSA